MKYYGASVEGVPIETIREVLQDNLDDRVFELEKQLHEQYAVNNNSNAGVLVSLIGALLIVVTGYGYVLYHFMEGGSGNVTMVHLMTIVAMAIMALLYCVSVNLGAGQRMEQFVTFAIRVKYYSLINKGYDDCKDGLFDKMCYEEIFPMGYHPFNKGFDDFVQGIYNLLSYAFVAALFVLPSCTIFLVDYFLWYYVLAFILIAFMILYKTTLFNKYQNREKYYMEKIPKLLEFVQEDTMAKDQSVRKQIIVQIHWTLMILLAIVVLAIIALPYVRLFVK